MKSPVVRWIFMISWLITALVAINTGLAPFGYNFFLTDFVQVTLYNNNLVNPLLYLILIAGLISLGLFVMSASGSYGYGSCKSKCK